MNGEDTQPLQIKIAEANRCVVTLVSVASKEDYQTKEVRIQEAQIALVETTQAFQRLNLNAAISQSSLILSKKHGFAGKAANKAVNFITFYAKDEHSRPALLQKKGDEAEGLTHIKACNQDDPAINKKDKQAGVPHKEARIEGASAVRIKTAYLVKAHLTTFQLSFLNTRKGKADIKNSKKIKEIYSMFQCLF